jgi:hypothetical protein
MSWIIQYLSGSTWVTKTDAVIDQIVDEINGQLGASGEQELDFILPNTPANLAFVQTDQQVQILWGSTVVFAGLLRAYKAKFITITATVYNSVFELMKKQTITGKYGNVAASTILTAICSACGMTAGSCPTTAISTQFNATDCYTAALNLANILGLNLFNSGNTVNIAVKGNQTPTAITIDSESEVDIDRSKAGYDGVIIRGVDQAGNLITGSAGNTGAGYNVKTLTNKIAMSQSTLNSLATEYLQSLQQTNSGSPLECDISQAALLNSGDLITVTNGTAFGLSGNYEICCITKTLTKATIEIVHSVNDFSNLVNAMASATTALNTLPVSSDQVQGSSVSLQSLQDFYHLGEGSGTVATDSSPAGNNGTIGSGCTWIPGPETKVLMFNGNGSYVDLPGSDVNFGGLSAMSFTLWFSPTSAAQGYLVYKANQFYVQVNANGSIVFGLYIGGTWVTLTTPAGSASLNGRLFGAFVYDGTNMYIYLNGPVLVQQAKTGAIGSSTNDTYLGSQTASSGGFTGVLSEVMFFGRALGPQEVYSLYFFPLISYLKSGSGGATTWSVYIMGDPNGSLSLSGLKTITAGSPCTVTDTLNAGFSLSYWLLDGVQVTGNPYTIPAQTAGSCHILQPVSVVTAPPVFWFASITTGNSDLKEEGDVADAILINDSSATRVETNVITNH